MVDVAFIVRQHEIVHKNIFIGEIFERFRDRHLALLARRPITPTPEMAFEFEERESGSDQSNDRELNVARCGN